jgi:hypothetical protein
VGQRQFRQDNLIVKCRQFTVEAAAIAMQVISAMLEKENKETSQ